MYCKKDDGKVGWGRRADACFATPASRNILDHNTTPLSLEHTFIGRALAKGSCLESIRGSSREQSVSSKQDVFSEVLECPSSAGGSLAQDKATTRFVEEDQKDFTLFPPGLTLKRDAQARNSRDKATQLCHACGETLHYIQHCGICGHDYCYKCASERLNKRDAGTRTDNSQQALRTELSIQGPDNNMGTSSIPSSITAKAIPKTPTRGLVTGNPFFLADQYSKGTLSAPHKTATGSSASRPRRLSDCVPRRFLDKNSMNVASHMPKDHQSLKQDDALQDIERHSLCCSAKMGPMTMNRNRADDGPKDDSLRCKISKLCRHAEEFHKSQVTLGHDDIAFEYRTRSKDSTTHSLVMDTAEKTPTRLPRRCPLPSLVGDDVVEVHGGEGENVTETGRAPQDVVAYDKVKGVALKFLHYLAPLDDDVPKSRPVPTASSSSSIKATERPADSEEHQHQESALRPLPLTLRQKNLDPADNSSKKGSSGKNGLDVCPVPGKDHHEAPPGRSIDGMALEPSADNELPSLTGYKRHRQDTFLCSKPQTPNPEPEPWPVLRKVEPCRENEQPLAQRSAPWSRLPLRGISSSVSCLYQLGEKVDSPISPRNKGEARRECEGTSHFTPSKIIPASTPISDWRCKLVKPADSAPNPLPKNVVCESCVLTGSRRLVSPIDNPPEACSRRSNSLVRSIKDTDSNLEDPDPFSEPRLSIRAIENSLAWQKVQDDLGKNIANGEAKDESTSPRPSPTTASNKSAGRKAATSGCSPPCSRTSQYRRLRDGILTNDDMLTAYPGGFEWKGNEGPSRYEGSAVEELGIEALTVVVHMRDRDNLVINTDLTGKRKQEG